MKTLKWYAVTLAAVFAVVGATASSAVALPDVSVTLGGSYPVRFHFHSVSHIMIFSNPVERIICKGMLDKQTFSELSSLGMFVHDFENCANERNQRCNTPGDAAGIVLVEGIVHVVYYSLFPLLLGPLFLPVAFVIECGALKIKGRGSMLGSLSLGESESEQLTTISYEQTGNGSGKPTLSTYYNASGEALKAKFELNFGSGYKEAAEEHEEAITDTVEEGGMVVITNR